MDIENSTKNQAAQACCRASAPGRSAFWGILLVILGGLGLLSNLVPLHNIGGYILPALLMLWGGFILFNSRRS